MDRYGNTKHTTFANRTLGEFDLAAAAGDRAAAVMATEARWVAVRHGNALSHLEPLPGPARRWLRTQIARLSARPWRAPIGPPRVVGGGAEEAAAR